jgi:hypothetical protein
MAAKRSFLLAASLALAWPMAAPAPTYFYDGHRLLQDCTSRNGNHREGCVGYLAGLSDAVETVRVWEKARLGICIPKGTTDEDLRAAFVGYAERYPDRLRAGGGGLALIAFKQIWPCDE